MNPFWGQPMYNYCYGYPMHFYQFPHQNAPFLNLHTANPYQLSEQRDDEKENGSEIIQKATEIKIKIEEKQDNIEETLIKVTKNDEKGLKENQGQKTFKKDKLRGNQKQYFKDDFRNVIPNIIYQIFSFLGKKYKSEAVLNKIFELYFSHQDEKLKVIFYQYQKFLKNKLSKHLNEKSLESLLKFADQLCVYYEQETQIIMIKISILMVNYFLQTEHHLIQVICGKKIGKEKLKTYFIGFRRIKSFFDEKVINYKENLIKK